MANTGWTHAASALNNSVLGARTNSAPNTGASWASLTNIVSDNNSDVTGTQNASTLSVSSNTLHARQYNHHLDIDSGATIDGAQARYERQVSKGVGTGNTNENQERFIDDGSAGTGTNFSNTGAWPTSRTLVTYGTSSAPQGIVYTDLDGTNFGFGIRVNTPISGKQIHTVNVDYCQTIIYFTDPPAAPSGVSAAQDGEDVDVTWTDNSDDEDNFEVSVSVNGGGYSVLSAAIAANTTTYTDTTGYSDGDTLDYRVRALKTSGPDSDYANASQITFEVGGGLVPLSLLQTKTYRHLLTR